MMHCKMHIGKGSSMAERSIDNGPTRTELEFAEKVKAATPARRKAIGLALQGGGSWGAYTWGVLDRVLASRSLRIAQLSGTSAGAINAAIVASALAKGRAPDARRALRSFWLGIAKPAMADLGRE